MSSYDSLISILLNSLMTPQTSSGMPLERAEMGLDSTISPNTEVRPYLGKSQTSLEGLDPRLVQLWKTVQSDPRYAGVTLRESWRTPEQAKANAAKGVGVVNSKHLLGGAFDLSAPRDTLAQIGQLAKSLGLQWGGDFKSLDDPWHFQVPESYQQLQQRYAGGFSSPPIELPAPTQVVNNAVLLPLLKYLLG